MMDNMSIYNAGRAVPATAIKQIKGGAYGAAGLSDINPQWRIEKLTEIFGACGTGWGWMPIDIKFENGHCYGHVGLWYLKEDGERSELVHGFGGTKMSERDDSDIIKSTVTDAVSNAARFLGIGADVWYKAGASAQFDTKYSTRQEQPKAQPKPLVKCEYCGEDLSNYPSDWVARSKANCNGFVFCKECAKKYIAETKGE